MNSSVLDEYNAFLVEYEEARQRFEQRAGDKLKDVFKQFFEENKKVRAVVWTQYTPYFNDGSECVFGIQDSVAFTNVPDPENVRWGEYEGEFKDAQVYTGYEARDFIFDTSACDQLRDIIENPSMTDILKTLFGDHCKVIATKKGIETIEFDHD